MKGKTIHEMNVGDFASRSLTITDSHVTLFAGITGDFNPVHVDEVAASNSMFQQRIAHGMLTGSLFSTLLGTTLPGEGSIYLGQDLKFLKPVFINDTITATVTVKELITEKNRVLFETTAINQHGDVVVRGVATILPPKE